MTVVAADFFDDSDSAVDLYYSDCGLNRRVGLSCGCGWDSGCWYGWVDFDKTHAFFDAGGLDFGGSDSVRH